MQQMVLLDTFFVLPVHVQMVVGLDAFETGLRLVPMSIPGAQGLVEAAGVPSDQAAAIAADHAQAELDGLRRALGVVALLAMLAFWFTRRLPGRGAEPPGAEVRAAG